MEEPAVSQVTDPKHFPQIVRALCPKHGIPGAHQGLESERHMRRDPDRITFSRVNAIKIVMGGAIALILYIWSQWSRSK
jgi:hypothetical protein